MLTSNIPLKDEKRLVLIILFAIGTRLLPILTDIPHERDKLCGVFTIEQKPLYCLSKL